ncbi:MAG: cytochrome P450 [Granulosicoccaceae bacterium]
MKPPSISIDPSAFWKDPYPALAQMRANTPICYVPELDAVLITKRDDIFRFEKNVDVFSSTQPGGLMTILMGENMMRKSGDPHKLERKQMQPSVSPTVTAKTWKSLFESDTHTLLDNLSSITSCDLVTDYAMPVSANALRRVTGLSNMTPEQLDASSQGMIDGIANYEGDKQVEARCHEMTALIDACIDEMLPRVKQHPDCSLLSTLPGAGQAMESVRANIKLAISGGQNEPRTAIAGTAWALLNNPDQLDAIRDGQHRWQQAFEEYVRWISPIGMSPRRIACDYQWSGIDFKEGDRAFFMYGSGNRDESVFDCPELFNIDRNTSKAIAFGAGPHFCAGAWVSRCLIGEVALPMLFERFPNLRLNGDAEFGGWAFRDLLRMPVRLQ